MKVHLLLIAFVFFQSRPHFDGKVTSVLDGDTIEVLKDGKAIRIRLNGIDSPEKSQAYGMKAKEFTSDMLFGKTVRVFGKENDRYGRLIADIYIDAANTSGEYGAWYNKVIVVSGYAWHYKAYSKDAELDAAEQTARRMKMGLWQLASPVAPWDYRKNVKEL